MSDLWKSIKKDYAEIAVIWGILELFNFLQKLYDLNISYSSGQINLAEYNTQILLLLVIYPLIQSIIIGFIIHWFRVNWRKITRK